MQSKTRNPECRIQNPEERPSRPRRRRPEEHSSYGTHHSVAGFLFLDSGCGFLDSPAFSGLAKHYARLATGLKVSVGYSHFSVSSSHARSPR